MRSLRYLPPSLRVLFGAIGTTAQAITNAHFLDYVSQAGSCTFGSVNAAADGSRIKKALHGFLLLFHILDTNEKNIGH